VKAKDSEELVVKRKDGKYTPTVRWFKIELVAFGKILRGRSSGKYVVFSPNSVVAVAAKREEQTFHSEANGLLPLSDQHTSVLCLCSQLS
jgi:hypothetical protein